MNVILAAALAFLLLMVLIMLRTPIAVAMIVSGLAGTTAISGWSTALATLKQGPFERATSYTLVVIPLFVLMGYLASQSGLSASLFRAANTWLGHRRGGLAMATVVGCAGFGAICGSSLAASATIATIALPEMRHYRYVDTLATGSVAAGGTLSVMIPPSIIFVLYGIMTEQSIGKLLLAGVVPGLVETVLFCVAIAVETAFIPGLGPAGPSATLRERLVAVRGVWEVLVLFVIVIGGLYAGLASPVESAAFGVVGALVFGVARRTLTWRGLLDALDRTVRTTSMIFLLIIGADLFGYFMALSQLPLAMASWLIHLNAGAMLVLWIILVLYLILGCVMDELAIILLTVPIFFPAVMQLGFDPIWFGVLIVVAVQIGLVSTPVGLNVLVIARMARDVPMPRIFRGIMPFLAAMIVVLVLLTVWPDFALVLPRNMK
jgi:C4-dicarboxylate transporter, DctM subunit